MKKPAQSSKYLFNFQITFILILLNISFSTFSYAASYESTKAITYYENGEYQRAINILSTIDATKDSTAAYMMGAIALKEKNRRPKHIDTAIHWFEISSKLNNYHAYRALGIAYEQRWLDNRLYSDFEKSQESYSYAMLKGVAIASSDLNRLNSAHEGYYKEKPKSKQQIINNTDLAIKPTLVIADKIIEQTSTAKLNTETVKTTAIQKKSANKKKSKSSATTDTLLKKDLKNSFMLGIGTVDVSGIGSMALFNGALNYYFMDNVYADIDMLTFKKTINGVDVSITTSNIGIGYDYAISSQLRIKAGVLISSLGVKGCNGSTCAEITDDGSSLSLGANYKVNESTELYARILKSSYDNAPDFDRTEFGLFHNFSLENSMYLVSGTSDGEKYQVIGYRRNF